MNYKSTSVGASKHSTLYAGHYNIIVFLHRLLKNH